MLLVERGIMFGVRGAGRGTAVDEEVDGVEVRSWTIGRGIPCPASG
jgi:hypothetical protein